MLSCCCCLNNQKGPKVPWIVPFIPPRAVLQQLSDSPLSYGAGFFQYFSLRGFPPVDIMDDLLWRGRWTRAGRLTRTGLSEPKHTLCSVRFSESWDSTWNAALITVTRIFFFFFNLYKLFWEMFYFNYRASTFLLLYQMFLLWSFFFLLILYTFSIFRTHTHTHTQGNSNRVPHKGQLLYGVWPCQWRPLLSLQSSLMLSASTNWPWKHSHSVMTESYGSRAPTEGECTHSQWEFSQFFITRAPASILYPVD